MIASNSMQTRDRLPALSLRALLLVLTLIVGVTSTAAAQPSLNNAVSPNEPGDISERFEVPNGIQFAPCAENPSLECGTLTVPVDYRKPHGEAFGMAVIRAKAADPKKRIGVLMTNPGGPGFSGVDLVLGGIRAPLFVRLRERFDVVSFDPRGVSRSRPVRCEVDGADFPTDPSDEALAAFFDDFSRRFAQACLEENGPFVTMLSTNNVARDMDALRRALGEQQITYASGSYGSELGAVYASLFPQRVRAMMLDGGVAPEFRDYFVEMWSEFSTAFELSFQRLGQLCSRDSACRLRDTGVVAAFDEVAARLKAEPVTSPNGIVLNDGKVVDVVATLLGSERTWPLIVNALADARAGNFTLFFQLLPFTATGGNALFPILCNDFGTRRPAAEYLPVDEAIGALNPHFFGRFFVASGMARCAAWPNADVPVIRNVKNRVAVPILLVGNDFDPNTPLSGTRSLARALGMERSLIRYQGGGHTAVGQIACIDNAFVAYLFDLTIPAEGFSCPGQPIRFTPPSAQADADGKRTMDAINRNLLWGQPIRVRQM